MEIHVFNTTDTVVWSILKNNMMLNFDELNNEIRTAYNNMLKETKSKNIDYSKLRNMLTPQKDKKEICLFFDSDKIKDTWYGRVVFNQYFPLINNFNNICVFEGDFIAENKYQEDIYNYLLSNVTQYNSTTYHNSSQYHLVYINNLTENRVSQIIDGLQGYENFVGYIDTTYNSPFKSLVSTTIGQIYFIHNKNVVVPSDEPDVNNFAYQVDDYGMNIINIDSVLYSSFLCYKIPRDYFEFDIEDQIFSINSVTKAPEEITKYDIEIEKEKYEYLRANKLHSLTLVGQNIITLEELRNFISNNFNRNYLFNIKYLENHNTIKFNVIIDLKHIETTKTVRLIIALEYKYIEKNLRLITMY